MQTSNIPPHITDGTFSDRSHLVRTIRSIDRNGITTDEDSLSMAARPETLETLKAGDQIIIEYLGPRPGIGAFIMGVAFEGRWLYETSDEQHAQWQEDMQRRMEESNREAVEKNRGTWAEIHVGLPGWLQTHAKKALDEHGETMDYGYSLMVLALAGMYASLGDEIVGKDVFSVQDSLAIEEFAREHGTTGNQHSMGLALAKAHLRGEV